MKINDSGHTFCRLTRLGLRAWTAGLDSRICITDDEARPQVRNDTLVVNYADRPQIRVDATASQRTKSPQKAIKRETTRRPYSSRVAPIPYHSQRIGETVCLPPK